MLPIALSLSTGDVILIIVFTTIPIALLTFVLGAKNALDQVGKGQFSVEYESDLPSKITDSDAEAGPAAREDEIRQLLEAKAYRQRTRGEKPVDVNAELNRLLTEAPAVPAGDGSAARGRGPAACRRSQRAPRPPGQGAARRRAGGRAPAA